MANIPVVTEINWDAPKEDFKKQVDAMIEKCRKLGKVLVLPLDIQTGIAFIGQLSLLLSNVRCEGCDATCCKTDQDPGQNGIVLMRRDREALQKLHLAHHIRGTGAASHLPTPCPFLEENRCSIYGERPFTCLIYPWQPGGAVGSTATPAVALASSCPEARRITRQVYITAWKVRQRMLTITGEEYKEVAEHEKKTIK